MSAIIRAFMGIPLFGSGVVPEPMVYVPPAPPSQMAPDYAPEQAAILSLLDRIEALEARVAMLEGGAA